MSSQEQSLMLLQICDLAKQWPNLKSLHDIAMSDLEEISRDAAKELVEREADRKKKIADEVAEQRAKDEEANQPRVMPPIERSMRGATASTYAEQGKDEEPKPEVAPKRLPGSESYFEATKEERR